MRFIIGGTGRKWSIVPSVKRRQAVLEHVASMVGKEHGYSAYETEEVIEKKWIGKERKS
jgi:monoamine oxidase